MPENRAHQVLPIQIAIILECHFPRIDTAIDFRTSNSIHWIPFENSTTHQNCRQNLELEILPIKIAMKLLNIRFYPSKLPWNSWTSILPIKSAKKFWIVNFCQSKLSWNPETSNSTHYNCQKKWNIKFQPWKLPQNVHPKCHDRILQSWPFRLSHVHRLWGAHHGWRTNCWSDGWPLSPQEARCYPRGAASTDSMEAPPQTAPGNPDGKWPLG